jgi:hypothetical protein
VPLTQIAYQTLPRAFCGAMWGQKRMMS